MMHHREIRSHFLFGSLFDCTEDQCLLERDEAGRVGGTDTGAAVLHRLVRDRELAKVVANHLGLNGGKGAGGGRNEHPRTAQSTCTDTISSHINTKTTHTHTHTLSLSLSFLN